jgi:hypothetical protein
LIGSPRDQWIHLHATYSDEAKETLQGATPREEAEAKLLSMQLGAEVATKILSTHSEEWHNLGYAGRSRGGHNDSGYAPRRRGATWTAPVRGDAQLPPSNLDRAGQRRPLNILVVYSARPTY